MPEWNQEVPKGHEIGTLIPNSTERMGTGAYPLAIREVIGKCTDDDGNEYEICRNAFTGEPLIRSTKTNRDWLITWAELLACAIACGIDAEVCPERWFNQPTPAGEASDG